MDTALFQGDNLIASVGGFTLPEQAVSPVQKDGKTVIAADIRAGGSISGCHPLYDFSGTFVGVLMIRIGKGIRIKIIPAKQSASIF